MYTSYRYKKLYDLYYTVGADGSVVRKGSYENNVQSKTYSNKVAYVHRTGTCSGIRNCISLNCKTSLYAAGQSPVLYISSNSKISRDALRHAGYKITYTKEKADYIVVDYPKEEMFDSRSCNAVLFTNDTLYMIDVHRENWNSAPFTDEEVKTIIKKIAEDYSVNESDVKFRPGLSNTDIQFVPDHEDWEYLITSATIIPKKHIIDCNIYYEGATKISPETLLIWSKMEDIKMFEKALINSDWKKYPVTVCLFLWQEKRYDIRNMGPAVDSILNAVNYRIYDRCRSLGGQMVTPEDWNMFQSYIMLHSGLSEKGGFIDKNSVYPYENFVRKKQAVAPKHINEQRSFSALLQELEINM